MDERTIKRRNLYDRVMPRVYNRSHSNSKTNKSTVTRHELSSTHIGAKTSASNFSSAVFKELPLVLANYDPGSPVDRLKFPKYVAKPKPKRTIKSLDPASSPLPIGRNREKVRSSIRVHSSVPCVTGSDPVGWSDSHVRQCFSSRSHTRLKELKDEIKAFQKTQRLMQFRSQLYKKCGVVLNDVGQAAEDKAIQVQEPDNAPGDMR